MVHSGGSPPSCFIFTAGSTVYREFTLTVDKYVLMYRTYIRTVLKNLLNCELFPTSLRDATDVTYVLYSNGSRKFPN